MPPYHPGGEPADATVLEEPPLEADDATTSAAPTDPETSATAQRRADSRTASTSGRAPGEEFLRLGVDDRVTVRARSRRRLAVSPGGRLVHACGVCMTVKPPPLKLLLLPEVLGCLIAGAWHGGNIC